ncbi:MAG: glutathione synthase [Deltaproteobacteria bacterium]|nr:glutathione synthase [Deltaproteobacteria bacterium]
MSKIKHKTTLTIGFVADPLENFDLQNETTLFLMHEATRRGWGCDHFELQDLFVKGTTPHALARQVIVKQCKRGFSYTVSDRREINLTRMHALFLRKDPPVDVNFIDHLTILELLNNKVLMVNNPAGIKLANEKILPLHFKGITPRTLVSKATQLICQFVRNEKTAILKVLNQAGGRGVIKVRADDTSLNAIIETLTHQQNRFIMAQQYLPEAIKGDKRILLLNGEILGAFVRVPSKKDFRGNLHSGARITATTITKRDREIVHTIKDKLHEMQLYFVGIDIIGGHCTEINTTSPMGIGEVNTLYQRRLEKNVMDWVAQQIS